MLRAKRTFFSLLLALCPHLRARRQLRPAVARRQRRPHHQARPQAGTVTFDVRSKGTPVSRRRPGHRHQRGDFTSGLAFVSQARRQLDETYQLPVGKRSTYQNHARELQLVFKKGEAELACSFRAYDDGSPSATRCAAAARWRFRAKRRPSRSGQDVSYWGQATPTTIGYETPLGPVTADPHLDAVAGRAGRTASTSCSSPRRRPTATTSSQLQAERQHAGAAAFPWTSASRQDHPALRVALARGDDLAGNIGRSSSRRCSRTSIPRPSPSWSTRPGSSPGRASWDFLAGDGDKLRTWIDFDAQMGWQYHFADAGWERRVPDMAAITAYGRSKGSGVVVWGKVANKSKVNTPERAEAWMAASRSWG
jgi:hypothetical protein